MSDLRPQNWGRGVASSRASIEDHGARHRCFGLRLQGLLCRGVLGLQGLSDCSPKP